MQFDITPTSLHDAVIEAQDALERLPNIEGDDGILECLKIIARAEKEVTEAYDEALNVIMAQVKDNIDMLNQNIGVLLVDAKDISQEALSSIRERVLTNEETFKDGKWITVSYKKPTIRLKSTSMLRGYIVAHPEAEELIQPVPASTSVRWKPNFVDEFE